MAKPKKRKTSRIKDQFSSPSRQISLGRAQAAVSADRTYDQSRGIKESAAQRKSRLMAGRAAGRNLIEGSIRKAIAKKKAKKKAK